MATHPDPRATTDGRTTVSIRFAGVAVAAAELIRLGEHAELLAPEPVRAELAAAGQRLVRRYSQRAGACGPAAPAAP